MDKQSSETSFIHKGFYILVSMLIFSMLFSCIKEKSTLDRISVRANKLVNEAGEVMVFHGVNISDPDKLENEGHWTKTHFVKAKEWGADLIRLPVHPRNWRSRGEEKYLALLDSAVAWANELEVYLIVEWHSIGNLYEEKFQSPMYITSIEETEHFWSVISKRYSDEPAVAFYEVYNEPTIAGERFGTMSWETWKTINERMIDIIRVNNPRAVVLVAGFDWAYDLQPVAEMPVERDGIVYVSHPYPQKREQPWEEKWQNDWGFVAEKYPVMLTEIGFALPDEKGVHIPVYGDENYGRAIVDFAAERDISWVIWCFDPEWPPLMFNDWDYTPSRQGAFFRQEMSK